MVFIKNLIYVPKKSQVLSTALSLTLVKGTESIIEWSCSDSPYTNESSMQLDKLTFKLQSFLVLKFLKLGYTESLLEPLQSTSALL
jgi:hypothetical protein